MKKNNKRLLSLISTMLVLLSLSACKNNNKNEPEVEKPTIVQEYVVPHLVSDTTDVEEEVRSLNITEDKAYPYDVYKVFRYINSDGYERINIVITYANFVTDSEGKIVGYYYTMVDAFDGHYIYTTPVNKNSFMNLEDIGDGDVKYIMNYAELSDLKTIAMLKGMDTNYVNSVMPDNLEGQTLTTSQVARYFVQLVNKNNRIYNDNQAVIILK